MTETLTTDNLTEDDIIELVKLCRRFQISKLLEQLLMALMDTEAPVIKATDNALTWLYIADQFYLPQIYQFCLGIMGSEANRFLNSSTFLNETNEQLLDAVLSSDYFFVDEEIIFNAILQWHRNNPEGDIDFLKQCLRLPLLSDKILFEIVLESNLFSQLEIESIIQKKFILPSLNCLVPSFRPRYYFRPNQKLTPDNYKIVKLVTHLSEKPFSQIDSAIMIEFDKPFLIAFLHFEFAIISCEILVEVSVDSKKWNEFGRSNSDYYFTIMQPQGEVMKHIRIKGRYYRKNRERATLLDRSKTLRLDNTAWIRDFGRVESRHAICNYTGELQLIRFIAKCPSLI